MGCVNTYLIMLALDLLTPCYPPRTHLYNWHNIKYIKYIKNIGICGDHLGFKQPLPFSQLTPPVPATHVHI